LTFDESLLSTPHDFQDYVIVHELLHVGVANHGKLWKSLMRAHLGDYESLEARLNRRAEIE
jgi:predicted metal-dependent hydrolase